MTTGDPKTWGPAAFGVDDLPDAKAALTHDDAEDAWQCAELHAMSTWSMPG